MRAILILDDDSAVRRSFCDFFEDHLWYPVPAESGEEALTLLQSVRPLAAIVDVRLPGIDGNEFICQASRLMTPLKFLVCTGSPEYQIPDGLQQMPNLCPRVFHKPVVDLQELERELIRMIDDQGTCSECD